MVSDIFNFIYDSQLQALWFILEMFHHLTDIRNRILIRVTNLLKKMMAAGGNLFGEVEDKNQLVKFLYVDFLGG